jgi:hypothetical protein
MCCGWPLNIKLHYLGILVFNYSYIILWDYFLKSFIIKLSPFSSACYSLWETGKLVEIWD